MATDYGWFQSQRIASRSKLCPRTTIEGEEHHWSGTDKRRRRPPRQHGPRSNLRANLRTKIIGRKFRTQILEEGKTMANPFDLKTVFLAKHAQHVVLIHFPIALFITAVAFDLIAHWTKRRGVADAAYYNLLGAAISTLPVLATGILAWQFQLDGQKLKGI